MIRLITRGDDAGSSVTANRAIRDCCVNGILRNVSVTACCDAVEDAAERLSGLDSVCFGFHATLNAEWTRVRWGSVAPFSEVASVVRDDGTFYQSVRDLESNRPAVDHAVTELQAQLDRGREVGFAFAYADQHMGFGRAIPGFDEAFDRWCESEGLLNFKLYHRRLPWVQKEGDAVEQFLQSLASADPGQWAVVGHPGYDTEELQQIGNDRIDGVDEARNRDGQRRRKM
jgi:predicted glycoside hydrolase/deacetylase ChbG (UPF0249 family)